MLGAKARGCNGTKQLIGPTGVVSSPGYPQKYGPYSDCSWKIAARLGYGFVTLQFDWFETEGCRYDYIEN